LKKCKRCVKPFHIGIITRGKYGHRLIYNIKGICPTVTTAALPVFIEDPAAFLPSSTPNIDPAVFGCDLVITYSLHPDITPEIVRQCDKRDAKVIIPGGRACAIRGTKTGTHSSATLHTDVGCGKKDNPRREWKC